jgi:hypothetical protein
MEQEEPAGLISGCAHWGPGGGGWGIVREGCMGGGSKGVGGGGPQGGWSEGGLQEGRHVPRNCDGGGACEAEQGPRGSDRKVETGNAPGAHCRCE